MNREVHVDIGGKGYDDPHEPIFQALALQNPGIQYVIVDTGYGSESNQLNGIPNLRSLIPKTTAWDSYSKDSFPKYVIDLPSATVDRVRIDFFTDWGNKQHMLTICREIDRIMKRSGLLSITDFLTKQEDIRAIVEQTGFQLQATMNGAALFASDYPLSQFANLFHGSWAVTLSTFSKR